MPFCYRRGDGSSCFKPGLYGFSVATVAQGGCYSAGLQLASCMLSVTGTALTTGIDPWQNEKICSPWWEVWTASHSQAAAPHAFMAGIRSCRALEHFAGSGLCSCFDHSACLPPLLLAWLQTKQTRRTPSSPKAAVVVLYAEGWLYGGLPVEDRHLVQLQQQVMWQAALQGEQHIRPLPEQLGRF